MITGTAWISPPNRRPRHAQRHATPRACPRARPRSLFQACVREEAVRFRAPNRSLTVAALFVITILTHPARASVRAFGGVAALLVMSNVAAAEEPADRFVTLVQAESTIAAEARALIEKTWSECEGCDGDEFITEGLVVLSNRFAAGLDAYDDDDYGQCASIMAELTGGDDPFLATYAGVYEIKALVAKELLPEAWERIKVLMADGGERVRRFSYFLAEMEFLRGFCLLGDLQYDEAADALEQFLREHPGASQRLTLAARQMLAELSTRQPGRIGEVVDLMTFASRRLTNEDSSQPVQVRQQRIIDLLDRLIEDAENQEQSSSSSSGGRGGSSKGRNSSNPMQDSSLPGGSSSGGPLRQSRRANPGDSWGSMPPADREQILQALKESFPGRYRRLVEQYYEELAKKKR